MTTVYNDRAAVGVYSSQSCAGEAVRRLVKANISLHDISIIGHDRRAREAASRHQLPANQVEQRVQQQDEQQGMWIGGLCGLLLGFGSVSMPGLGRLVVLGPLSEMVGTVQPGETEGELAGQSAFADIALDYRDRLVVGNILVMVHCTMEDETRVQEYLESMNALSFKTHNLELATTSQSELPSRISAKPEIKRIRNNYVERPTVRKPKVPVPTAIPEQTQWDSDGGAQAAL